MHGAYIGWVPTAHTAPVAATHSRSRAEAQLRRAEAAARRSLYEESLSLLDAFAGWHVLPRASRIRALRLVCSAAVQTGALDRAASAAAELGEIQQSAGWGPIEAAEANLAVGMAAFTMCRVRPALDHLTRAVHLVEHEPDATGILVESLCWRSRCWRRVRELDAAAADVDHALEVAESQADERLVALAAFQASLIAERQGQLRVARAWAERARDAYVAIRDDVGASRITNNLGGLAFVLGDPDEAVELLKDSVRLALRAGLDADAARAIGSLAQVRLQTGDVDAAERHARHVLIMLAGRTDQLAEIGSAHMTLARAMRARRRTREALHWVAEAVSTYAELGSSEHVATAWTLEGDILRDAGDTAAAAERYRQALERTLDVRF